jgi:hypothetical protein
LRNDGPKPDLAGEGDRQGPVASHSTFDHQGRSSRTAAGVGEPSYNRDPTVGQLGDETAGRESERVGDQNGPDYAIERRNSTDRDTSRSPHSFEVICPDVGAGQRPQPNGKSRPFFDLDGVADDPFGDGPHPDPGNPIDGLRQIIRSIGMVGRGEHKAQIRR